MTMYEKRDEAVRDYERMPKTGNKDSFLFRQINLFDTAIIAIEIQSFGSSTHKRYFNEKS